MGARRACDGAGCMRAGRAAALAGCGVDAVRVHSGAGWIHNRCFRRIAGCRGTAQNDSCVSVHLSCGIISGDRAFRKPPSHKTAHVVLCRRRYCFMWQFITTLTFAAVVGNRWL